MPELSDDLTTRLSALGGEGRADLPGAAAARRRGAQRTRRTRLALGSGGAAVAVTAVLLSGDLGGSGQDRVSIPAATPAPAPVAADPLLEDALLDADDVGAELGRPWAQLSPAPLDRSSSPLPADCLEGVDELGPQVAGRSFALDGRVGHLLRRYAEPEQARAAYDRVVALVEQCPATRTPTTRTAGGLPGTRLDAERVTADGSVHLTLELRGPFLVAVSASQQDALPALAAAARRELTEALARRPDELVGVLPGGPDVRAALLEPADAQRVSPGAPWSFTTRSGDGSEEVPAFPCGTGPAPQVSGDARQSAGVQLSVERTGGRTVVRQDVERYTGPTTAQQAYDLVRERVASCPEQSLPDVSGPGTVVHEVVADRAAGGVRTLLVRAVTACDDCPPATAWFAVQQAGPVLSALRVDDPEAAGRGVSTVEPFAAVVAEGLSDAG